MGWQSFDNMQPINQQIHLMNSGSKPCTPGEDQTAKQNKLLWLIMLTKILKGSFFIIMADSG